MLEPATAERGNTFCSELVSAAVDEDGGGGGCVTIDGE